MKFPATLDFYLVGMECLKKYCNQVDHLLMKAKIIDKVGMDTVAIG